MKTSVYLKSTGLGGVIITEIGCDYVKVNWNDGTTSVVNYSELEIRWWKKIIYYFPNLEIRFENKIHFFFEDTRVDAFIYKLLIGAFIGFMLSVIL